MKDLAQPFGGEMIGPGHTPRKAPVRDAILRLADGTRTAAQIGAILGISQNNVRVRAHELGIAHMLRHVCGGPVSARLPPALVVRDLGLPPEVSLWLIAQTASGATIQDVLRGIVTDAYHEETGL